MQIFNIGPVELLLILLIMFILLGPEGMIRTARQIGAWVRNTIKSPIWRDIMGYSREIRELPTKIVRETGLDEDLEEIRKSTQEATDELQQSVDEANKEVNASLKETGSVDVRIDTSAPPKSQPMTDSKKPAQTGSSTEKPPGKPAVENTIGNKGVSAGSNGDQKSAEPTSAPLPPAQTYQKYSGASEEEED